MRELDYCDHGRDEDNGTDNGWAEYDARGIYLTKVCDKCRKHKLSKYRRDVLADPSYECDEPIEPEEY